MKKDIKYKIEKFFLDLLANMISIIGYAFAWLLIGLFWVIIVVLTGCMYVIATPYLVIKLLWTLITTGKLCHGLEINISNTKENKNA